VRWRALWRAGSWPAASQKNKKTTKNKGFMVENQRIQLWSGSWPALLPANSCSFDSVRLYGIIWMAQFANENFEKVR
jgi:hypothetical protein